MQRTTPAYEKTAHFEERQAQRQIPHTIVALALRFGTRRYDRGDIVYFLGRRHLPKGIADDLARRAEGTVVITAQNGALITTFRNSRFLKKSRKRSPHRAFRRESDIPFLNTPVSQNTPMPGFYSMERGCSLMEG